MNQQSDTQQKNDQEIEGGQLRSSSAPLLSIVTPTFNSVATVEETIRSVMDQGDVTVEHIVMDGGSTDGTIEILKKYPHIRWFSEKDEGHYHAMHKGVLESSGRYFCILNSDDYFRPGALAAIAGKLKDDVTLDGVFGDVVFIDNDGNELYRREEACFDYDVLRFALGYVIHPTFFLAKDLYLKIGGFRYKELKNCADYDLILRAGKSTQKIGHVNFLLVNYRFHIQGQSADRRIQKNMAKEAALLKKEHGKSDGLAGKFQEVFYKGKRQLQKLFLRGKIDLISGKFHLRKVMRDKCDFSSNIGLDKMSD